MTVSCKDEAYLHAHIVTHVMQNFVKDTGSFSDSRHEKQG